MMAELFGFFEQLLYAASGGRKKQGAAVAQTA
jgi:hypothetical protein